MADVIRSRIGQVLLEKGVTDEETIKKALEIQEECEADNRRRRLGDILVEDLQLDHDKVFSAIAETYAFKKLDLAAEEINEERVEFIKKLFDDMPDEVVDTAIAHHMIPFKASEDQPGLIYLITPDPTNNELAMIAARMKLKRYESLYAPLSEIQNLIEKAAPTRNDFLEMVEEASQSV